MNIVITGGSRGIGRAIAERFGKDKQEHTIIICARDKEQLEIAAKELQVQFPKTTILFKPADLSKKNQIVDFATWVLSLNIRIDVLINNAGQFLPGSIHNEAEGTLERMIEVNLYSAYYVTRLLLPEMMKVEKGHIFNMCSIASLQAYSNGGSYSISKFALMGFSKNLREELKPYDIKVTAVYPGAVYTDSWVGSGVEPRRIMEANDIAELVYAASGLSTQACVEDIVIRPQLGDL